MQVEWIITDRNNTDFIFLCGQLNHELVTKLPGPVDPISSRAEDTDDFQYVLLGKADGIPIACAAIRPFSQNTAELKRMYVSPEWRRRGLGMTIIEKCEAIAHQCQYRTIVLETNTRLPDARSLYEKAGYEEPESYWPYAFLDDTFCMKKDISQRREQYITSNSN